MIKTWPHSTICTDHINFIYDLDETQCSSGICQFRFPWHNLCQALGALRQLRGKLSWHRRDFFIFFRRFRPRSTRNSACTIRLGTNATDVTHGTNLILKATPWKERVGRRRHLMDAPTATMFCTCEMQVLHVIDSHSSPKIWKTMWWTCTSQAKSSGQGDQEQAHSCWLSVWANPDLLNLVASALPHQLGWVLRRRSIGLGVCEIWHAAQIQTARGFCARNAGCLWPLWTGMAAWSWSLDLLCRAYSGEDLGIHDAKEQDIFSACLAQCPRSIQPKSCGIDIFRWSLHGIPNSHQFPVLQGNEQGTPYGSK